MIARRRRRREKKLSEKKSNLFFLGLISNHIYTLYIIGNIDKRKEKKSRFGLKRRSQKKIHMNVI
jgi:hypothetical protein